MRLIIYDYFYYYCFVSVLCIFVVFLNIKILLQQIILFITSIKGCFRQYVSINENVGRAQPESLLPTLVSSA
jgi:hypothetical protein